MIKRVVGIISAVLTPVLWITCTIYNLGMIFSNTLDFTCFLLSLLLVVSYVVFLICLIDMKFVRIFSLVLSGLYALYFILTFVSSFIDQRFPNFINSLVMELHLIFLPSLAGFAYPFGQNSAVYVIYGIPTLLFVLEVFLILKLRLRRKRKSQLI